MKGFTGFFLILALGWISAGCGVDEPEGFSDANAARAEARSMAIRIAAEDISDNEIDAIARQLNTRSDLAEAVDGILQEHALDDHTLQALIFAAGHSKNPRFAASLQAIATSPVLPTDVVGEPYFRKREIERLASVNALGDIGDLATLEHLYENTAPWLRNTIRMELNGLDPANWSMRTLPPEILESPNADAAYAKHFYKQLEGLHSDGVVVFDDEIDWNEEFQEISEYITENEDEPLVETPPPPTVRTPNQLSSVEINPLTKSASSTTVPYACGITSANVPRLTSNELNQTSEWCNNKTISDYWRRYDFDGSWNAAMGYNDPCNLNLPLGRTFNAIHLLHTAAADAPSNYSDTSGSLLRKGGNYAMGEIPKLKASCAKSPVASVRAKILKKKRHLTLYRPFFYSYSTATRAGIIIHEARHTQRCRHNGNDGNNKCFANSDSCDESLYDGCKNLALAPNGAGGVGYEILWLWQYIDIAKPSKKNLYHRRQAAAEANLNLNQYLDVHPYFNIRDNGRIKWCASVNGGECQ